ncbi:uncharacterized protein METZ01_LOCUS394100 [marine metagenome]|uniref:Uncharacterized protein n=1 Tax=marine metagenome TaxID=408172 RepID=A0A382V3W5_9ZZZZ
MTSPQRCGTVDNPHKFDPDVVVPRCTKCNKHLRDIHVSDSIDNLATMVEILEQLD